MRKLFPAYFINGIKINYDIASNLICIVDYLNDLYFPLMYLSTDFKYNKWRKTELKKALMPIKTHNITLY